MARHAIFYQLGIFCCLLLIAPTTTFVLKLPRSPSPGRILCLFVTKDVDSFSYHLNLADLLARTGYNVTVLGVLPLPIPFKSSAFVYQRLGRVEMQSNQYGSMDNWHEHHELDKNFECYLQQQGENAFDLVILAYYRNMKHLERAGCFRKPIILSTDTEAALPSNWELSGEGDYTYLREIFAETTRKYVLRLERALGYFWSPTQFMRVLDLPKMATPFACPTLNEVLRSIPLIFTNQHLVQGSMPLQKPAMISIAGIQIPAEISGLPSRIAHFLDAPKQGAIYINLGSNSNCTQHTSHAYELLYSSLLRRRTHVIWKWTGACSPPGAGSHILFEKWLTQSDVLAHRNVDLFITDGGLNSINEALYFGVPILALPFDTNQKRNVQSLVQQGFGFSIDPFSASSAELERLLDELMLVLDYRYNIKRFSNIYRDRPQTPQKTALYWVDYVLRYDGAEHMTASVGWDQLDATKIDWLVLLSVTCLALNIVAAFWASLGKTHNDDESCMSIQEGSRNSATQTMQAQEVQLVDSCQRVEKLDESQQEERLSTKESDLEAELSYKPIPELTVNLIPIQQLHAESAPELDMKPKQELSNKTESDSGAASMSDLEPQPARKPMMELVAMKNEEESLVIERVLTRNQKRRIRKKRNQKPNKLNGTKQEKQIIKENTNTCDKEKKKRRGRRGSKRTKGKLKNAINIKMEQYKLNINVNVNK